MQSDKPSVWMHLVKPRPAVRNETLSQPIQVDQEKDSSFSVYPRVRRFTAVAAHGATKSTEPNA
jgi:hypothetical protein